MTMKYKDLPRNENGEIQADKVEFPVEYTLLRPVGEHSQAVMREPTVLDLEMSRKKKNEMESGITMMSNLLELTPEEVRGMSTRDYSRLSEVIAAFL